MTKQCAALKIVMGVFAVSWVAVSGLAKTVNSATCSRDDVATALAAATYGDTVLVPAGTCTWSSTLLITRGVVLTGAGSSLTTLRSGSIGGNMIIYRPDATSVSTNARFEISGFTFDMANGGDGGLWLDNNSNTPISQVLVHHNVFKDQNGGSSSLSNSCIYVGERGDVYGVLYSNTFQNCKVVGRNYGDYANSWNTTTFTYGNADNFYWEDNILVGNSAFHFGGHGGRYAARFNQYTFTDGSWEVLWDVHGNQPGGVYATMGCEIYGNTISLARGTTVIDHRGGACMLFKNTVTGSTGSWQVREEYDDSITPFTNSRPQHVSDSYYFLNTFNGNSQRVNESGDCCSAITENQHFWNYTTSFNGSAGIGAGLLSARPTSCTVGVGYWATDQGEWNSNQPGPDGQLYKCSSPNTWTLHYRPYTYPHPLRTGAAPAPPPPPAPPTGLQATSE